MRIKSVHNLLQFPYMYFNFMEENQINRINLYVDEKYHEKFENFGENQHLSQMIKMTSYKTRKD